MIFYLVITLILKQTMITIRRNVFETNSSSTHTITIIPNDGNEYYIQYGDLITEKERNKNILRLAKSEFGEHSIEYNEFLEDLEIAFKKYRSAWNDEELPLTPQEYIELDNYLECDVEDYTTKSGDRITIICKYGFDY